MTDKELQDFIEHGENGFVEFAMVFGDGWAKHAIEIAKESRRLHEVNAELVEALRLMNIECQHLHHSKKDQHGYDVACPVVERIKTSIAKATGEQQ
jgi:hypothetical protein